MSEPETMVKFEREEDESEMWFALFCMADELHGIRDYIRDLWLQYAKQALSLLVVSVTTNTAIELSDGTVNDFSTIPRCGWNL